MNFLTSALFFLASSKEAQNGLYNAQNFVKYENFMLFPINTIKWWIIEFVYGIANFASELLTHVVGVGDFITKQLNGSGELGQWISYARIASMTVASAYLLWVAIRFVIAKEPPHFKNIALQLITSIFLIVSLSDITTTLVSASTDWYNGFTATDTNKGANKNNKDVSDLPFQVIASSTNDLEYMILHNFDGTNAPAKSKVTIDTSKVDTNVPPVKYGFNDLTKTEVNDGTVNFDQVIQWPDVDGGGGTSDAGSLNKLDSKIKGKNAFKFGWLIYQMKADKDDKGKVVVSAPDIPRVGTTIFAFGGYPRFQVDFLPVMIVLCTLIVAYAFASYAIIKSFLELGLMNILGVFLFAVDLDSGQKTKQVIQAVFSTSLLVALQGFEIAFYKIIMLWAMNAKNAGDLGKDAMGTWVFVIIALVACMLVITGSQKVTQFFGVDTGAQHGLRAMGSAIYSAKQIGKGAMAMGQMPGKAISGVKNTRDNLGHAMNTKGSIKRDAKKQAKDATRQQVLDQMAGVTRYGEPTTGNFGNNDNTKLADLQAGNVTPSSVGNMDPNAGTIATPAPEEELDNKMDQADKKPNLNNAKNKVASQIKPLPGAEKARAKALNKGVKASEQGLRRQANRNMIAHNMASALHNAKKGMQGKEMDAPMKSWNFKKPVEQLAKPYSKHDPKAEGLSYTKQPGLDGAGQSVKRALSMPQPSEQTKRLAGQLKQDEKALMDATAQGAPKEERQMLQNNVSASRQALNESIDNDRQAYALRQSNQPQKLSELAQASNKPITPNSQNIAQNQAKVGQSRLSSGKQERISSATTKVNSNAKPLTSSTKNINSPAKITKNPTPSESLKMGQMPKTGKVTRSAKTIAPTPNAKPSPKPRLQTPNDDLKPKK